MKAGRDIRDTYYTEGEEWINFQGSVATAGVTLQKLGPLKQFRQLKFRGISGMKKQGDIIAIIHSGRKRIEVHMPVDGRIFELNEELLAGNNGLLLSHPERGGWLFKLIPARPYDRAGLSLPMKAR